MNTCFLSVKKVSDGFLVHINYKKYLRLEVYLGLKRYGLFSFMYQTFAMNVKMKSVKQSGFITDISPCGKNLFEEGWKWFMLFITYLAAEPDVEI